MKLNQALRIIDQTLISNSLSDLQELIFRESWHHKTYVEIAEQHGYDNDYVRETGAQLWHLLSDAFGEKVTKRNLHAVLGWMSRQKTAEGKAPKLVNPAQAIRHDRGNTPEQAFFFGRVAELDMLRTWINHQDCRMVGILGMGGTGKTALSSYLVQQIQTDFDYLIWRSVRNAPLLKDLLADMIQRLSGNSAIAQSLPSEISDRIRLLMRYLETHRCLLVLDNFESLLEPGQACGRYRSGYEDYGLLLKQIGEYSNRK